MFFTLTYCRRRALWPSVGRDVLNWKRLWKLCGKHTWSCCTAEINVLWKLRFDIHVLFFLASVLIHILCSHDISVTYIWWRHVTRMYYEDVASRLPIILGRLPDCIFWNNEHSQRDGMAGCKLYPKMRCIFIHVPSGAFLLISGMLTMCNFQQLLTLTCHQHAVCVVHLLCFHFR